MFRDVIGGSWNIPLNFYLAAGRGLYSADGCGLVVLWEDVREAVLFV